MRTREMTFRSARRAQSGIALLLVLLATGVAAVLAVGFMVVQSTSAGMGDSVHHYAQARAVAEAAVSMALEEARSGTSWRRTRIHGVWSPPVTMMGGVALVKFEDGIDGDTDMLLGDDDVDSFTVTALATVEGVTYTAEVAVAVEAYAGDLLMIVPDAARLNWQDHLMVELFERWGYDVSFVSASVSTPQVLAAAERADVVYIASSISSSQLGPKITDTVRGVVAHEVALNDELGFNRASVRRVWDDRCDLVNNTHPITQGLPLGELRLFDQRQEIRYLNGPLTDEAVLLGKHWNTARPLAAALERGAMTTLVGPAKGRRVLLTWTDTADPSWLTDPHRQLIRQSLEWAATRPEALIVGEDREGAYQSNNVHGMLLATRVTLERDMDVREIAALVKGPSSKAVRLAIYTDRDNDPDRLVVQTDAAPAGGPGSAFEWTRFTLDETSLAAGNYWLVFNVEHKNQSVSYHGEGELRIKFESAIASGYPQAWGRSHHRMAASVSIYMNGDVMVGPANGTPLLFPRWIERTR